MIPRPLNLVHWDALFQEPFPEKVEHLLILRHGHIYLVKKHISELPLDEVFYEVFLRGADLYLRKISAQDNSRKGKFRGVANSLIRMTEDEFFITIGRSKKLRCKKDLSRAFRVHDKVLLLCTNKNRARVLSPTSNDIVEIRNVVMARGPWTQLIAGNIRGEALALIIDPLRGLFREYRITNCIPNSAVCGDSLCVIKCNNEEYYAITYDGIHAIPADLLPLASCGNSEYYFDVENNLLTKYLGGVLEPLVDIKPQCIVCYDAADAVLSDSTGTYLLHGNTLFKLTDLPSKEIASSKPIIAIRAKADRYIIINASRRVSGEVHAKSCVPTAEGPVLCIVNEGIAILSPFEFFNPKIKVLRDFVDYDGYAIVEIEPWSPGSNYRVKGPIITVNTVATGSKAIVALRPRRLGWSGSAILSAKLPIYHISSSFHIASKEPSLGRLSLTHCVFLKGGYIKESNCNFKAILEAMILSPVPEEPSLELSCSSLSNYHVRLLKKECTLSNSRKFVLEVTGYSKDSSKIPLEVILKYNRGDMYKVGRSIIDLSKYVLNNPLDSSKLIIDHLDNSKTIIRSIKGAKLQVSCSNGRVFEGIGNVVVSECLEPLLVTEELVNDDYVWRKEHVVECTTKYVITNGPAFAIDYIKSREGGIICRGTSITLPKDLHVSVRLAKLEMRSRDTIETTLKLKTNIPSLISIKCGDTLVRTLVENEISFSMRCSVHDILNGLDIVVIPVGMDRISQCKVKPKEVLQLLLQNAVKTAETILRITPGLKFPR